MSKIYIILFLLSLLSYQERVHTAQIITLQILDTEYPIYYESTGLIIFPGVKLTTNTLKNQSLFTTLTLFVVQAQFCGYTLDTQSNHTQNLILGFKLKCPLALSQGSFTENMNLTLFAYAEIQGAPFDYKQVPLQIIIIKSYRQYWILGFIFLCFLIIGIIAYIIERKVKKNKLKKLLNQKNQQQQIMNQETSQQMLNQKLLIDEQDQNQHQQKLLFRQKSRQERERSKQFMVNISSFTKTHQMTDSLNQTVKMKSEYKESLKKSVILKQQQKKQAKQYQSEKKSKFQQKKQEEQQDNEINVDLQRNQLKYFDENKQIFQQKQSVNQPKLQKQDECADKVLIAEKQDELNTQLKTKEQQNI